MLHFRDTKHGFSFFWFLIFDHNTGTAPFLLLLRLLGAILNYELYQLDGDDALSAAFTPQTTHGANGGNDHDGNDGQPAEAALRWLRWLRWHRLRALCGHS